MDNHQPNTKIRYLGEADLQELAQLAELDTAAPLHAPVLGAIVDGHLVAAHSLANGESIADPFRHTNGHRTALARRARELRGEGPGRGLIARLRRRSAGPVRGGASSHPAQ